MTLLTDAWRLLRKTFSESSRDRTSRLAASLAYYAVFCIAPLLVIALRLAGHLFGQKAARHELDNQLGGMMGKDAAKAVLSLVGKASEHPAGGFLATVFSIALFIYTALVLFDELQQSMNTIWNVERKPRTSWWRLLRDQAVSLGIVIGTLLLFIVSLTITTTLPAVVHYLHTGGIFGRVVEIAASLVVFTLVFACVYKFLPDVQIAWSDVWIAAVSAGVLFTLGKYLLGAYLGHAGGRSIYGVTGAVAVVLVWVFYSARVFFFWAEFTQVYSRRDGQPEPSAADRQSPV